MEGSSCDTASGKAATCGEDELGASAARVGADGTVRAATHDTDKDHSAPWHIEMMRCGSLDSLPPDVRLKLLQTHRLLIPLGVTAVKMTGVADTVRRCPASERPCLVGPTSAVLRSPWFRLFLFHHSSSGPACLLCPRGAVLLAPPQMFQVRGLVGWLVDWLVGWLVGWRVCVTFWVRLLSTDCVCVQRSMLLSVAQLGCGKTTLVHSADLVPFLQRVLPDEAVFVSAVVPGDHVERSSFDQEHATTSRGCRQEFALGSTSKGVFLLCVVFSLPPPPLRASQCLTPDPCTPHPVLGVGSHGALQHQ